MSLATARKRAGLTQQQVAAMLGVTVAAVSLWERGGAMPNAKRLPKLAAVYGCTIDELLTE